MKIVILGAAGFIGTNLALKLAENKENDLLIVDEKMEYFDKSLQADNVKKITICFSNLSEYAPLFQKADIVYHLISTNNPTSSNLNIGNEITDNISITLAILEGCIRNNVKKLVFLSSGGTVYGKVEDFPIKEDHVTNPITTYGVQKLTIEKLLYLYNYVYGLDYSIIRLSNPYGPHQRPNGRLGAVTTFTYKALKGEELVVYGDGSVVRDYIYIDDAVRGIIKITMSNSRERIFNLGSGIGISINELLTVIRRVLDTDFSVRYIEKRSVDVPINYLDVSKYENIFGKANLISIEEGVRLTAKYLSQDYE